MPPTIVEMDQAGAAVPLPTEPELPPGWASAAMPGHVSPAVTSMSTAARALACRIRLRPPVITRSALPATPSSAAMPTEHIAQNGLRSRALRGPPCRHLLQPEAFRSVAGLALA